MAPAGTPELLASARISSAESETNQHPDDDDDDSSQSAYSGEPHCNPNQIRNPPADPRDLFVETNYPGAGRILALSNLCDPLYIDRLGELSFLHRYHQVLPYPNIISSWQSAEFRVDAPCRSGSSPLYDGSNQSWSLTSAKTGGQSGTYSGIESPTPKPNATCERNQGCWTRIRSSGFVVDQNPGVTPFGYPSPLQSYHVYVAMDESWVLRNASHHRFTLNTSLQRVYDSNQSPGFNGMRMQLDALEDRLGPYQFHVIFIALSHGTGNSTPLGIMPVIQADFTRSLTLQLDQYHARSVGFNHGPSGQQSKPPSQFRSGFEINLGAGYLGACNNSSTLFWELNYRMQFEENGSNVTQPPIHLRMNGASPPNSNPNQNATLILNQSNFILPLASQGTGMAGGPQESSGVAIWDILFIEFNAGGVCSNQAPNQITTSSLYRWSNMPPVWVF